MAPWDSSVPARLHCKVYSATSKWAKWSVYWVVPNRIVFKIRDAVHFSSSIKRKARISTTATESEISYQQGRTRDCYHRSIHQDMRVRIQALGSAQKTEKRTQIPSELPPVPVKASTTDSCEAHLCIHNHSGTVWQDTRRKHWTKKENLSDSQTHPHTSILSSISWRGTTRSKVICCLWKRKKKKMKRGITAILSILSGCTHPYWYRT